MVCSFPAKLTLSIFLLFVWDMSSPASSESFGPVLVIGGCGFVGFHIVQHLLEDPNSRPISVLSRNPNLNRCEGVSYHT